MAAPADSNPLPAPPATPQTQEEIDRHWLENVYKPEERQLTVRAVLMGCLLGGIMSVSNLYIGLKIGWSMGMAITSTILAFAFFQALHKAGILKHELTKLENNTIASAASAAGYYCSAGMVSAIPALFLTQQRTLSWLELALWMSAVSFVGVLMAIPMRRQMIDVDRLKFPSGVACAETIRSMHDTAAEAAAKAKSLLYGALIAALFEIPYSIHGIVDKAGKVIFKNPLTWNDPLTIFPKRLRDLTIGLPASTLLYGAGAIMGIRVGLSMAVGALVLYGVFVPWLNVHGIVQILPDDGTFPQAMAWSVWPGVMAALAASLLSFGLKWRTIASAFKSLGRLAKSGGQPSGMAAVEVPNSWFLGGMLLATIFIAACARAIFNIPVWMSVLAVALSFVLSIVACRATGETDVTPIGALGKITQFMYAGIRPGHIPTNLMTASITAGSASHSADLLTDLKTGYLLGGSPRRQFIAQFLGIVAGAVFCVPAYMLVARPEKLATPQMPAPAALTWATVADLLAHGIQNADRGDGLGEQAHVQKLHGSTHPAGATVGDLIDVGGVRYTIDMVDKKDYVLDKDITVPEAGAPATIYTPDGKKRGELMLSDAGTMGAVHFTQEPAGTRIADYVIAHDPAGKKIFHRVKGMRGDVAILDHPFVDSPSGPVSLHVQKMSLPPYALEATIIAVLIGILLTLLEVYGPKAMRAYLPSVTGIGIAWVITAHDSLAMAIGAGVAWILAKAAPKLEERYNVSTSSGIIAGASIMGLLIILFRDILHYIT